MKCNERWYDSQGDEINASRENSLTGSGAKQTQTMHPVVNVASRASITTIACDRTNYFVSTGCIIPSGIRVYTNNVSESRFSYLFSPARNGWRYRGIASGDLIIATNPYARVCQRSLVNMAKEIWKVSRISAISFFFFFFFLLIYSPFDGLLFLKRRNFRHDSVSSVAPLAEREQKGTWKKMEKK